MAGEKTITPTRMVNLQSLLRLLALFAAPVLGLVIGQNFGGFGFGILFALLAVPIAWVVVETPYWIANRREEGRIVSASAEALKNSLNDDFRHYGHLRILRELRQRGESIEFELPRLLQFLVSPSVTNRVAAAAALREFFPSIKTRLAGYNPYHPDAPNSPAVAELLRELLAGNPLPYTPP